MCLTISSKHIYGDAIYSPYGISSVAGMRSVSLALNETKTIRCYINTSGSSLLRAEPVNGTADSSASKEYFSDDIRCLANIELTGFTVEKAHMTYVPVSEWGDGFTLSTSHDANAGKYQTYKTLMSGSLHKVAPFLLLTSYDFNLLTNLTIS